MTSDAGSGAGTRIAVAVPGLVVLVGAAGAGKSTLVAALFAPSEVLSSDAYREAVSGDPGNQRVTPLAFSILHREVRRRLGARQLVVVDATNVERHARLSLVRIARAVDVPVHAIVLAPPADVVHLRNATRSGRVVPVDVVDRHLEAMGRLGVGAEEIAATLRLEGFATAHVLDGSTDLAGVAIIRGATADPTP